MSRLRELRKEAQVALPTSGEVYKADDGTVSTVLDDQYDPGYEPSDEELKNYAEWLGMSLPEDEELMWLAREGLKAPVPKEWKACKTDTGEVYYFNFKTGESLWDHPLDDYFKDKFAKEKAKVDEKRAREKIEREQSVKEEAAERRRKQRENEEKERQEREHRQREDEARRERDRREADEKREREAAQRREAAATAAAKRNNLRASSSGASTPVDELGTPTGTLPSAAIPAASSAAAAPAGASGGTRLLTEADKRRQAAIKKEMEEELAKRLAEADDDFAADEARLEREHKRNLESAKSAAALKLRQAVQDAEDRAQDTLDTRQADAETRSKRDIQKLEAEVDDVRDEIRRLQKQQYERIANGETEIDSSVAAQVRKRLTDVETEVLAERQAHAGTIKAMETQQRLVAETEADAAIANAVEAAEQRYSAAADEKRAQHQQAVDALATQAKASLDEERERIERASRGEATQLVRELEDRTDAEVAAIDAAAKAEVASVEAAEQAALDELRRTQQAEFEAASAGAGSSDPDAEAALRQRIDIETEEALADLHRECNASWSRTEQELEQQRRQRVAEARSIHGDGNEDVDVGAVEAKLRAQHHQRVTDTRALYEREEREARQKAAELQDKATAEATRRAEAEVSSAFDAWVQEQVQAHRRIVVDNERATSSAAAASAEARAALADIEKARRDYEQRTKEQIRDARQRHEAELNKSLAALADELAAEEQRRRRTIETEIASPNASAAARAMPSDEPAPEPIIVYDDAPLLEAKLSELRSEYAVAEQRLRSQPFLHSNPSSPHRGAAPEPQQHQQPAHGDPQLHATGGSNMSSGRPGSGTPMQHFAHGTIDLRQPSMQSAVDYVVDQARDAETRRDTLTAARGEWKESSHSLRQSSSSQLGMYASQQAAGGDSVGPEVVRALEQLNERVDQLLLSRGSASRGDRLRDAFSSLDEQSPVRRPRQAPQRRSSATRRSRTATRTLDTSGNGGRRAQHHHPRSSSNPPQRDTNRGDGDRVAPKGRRGSRDDDSAVALAQRWNRVLENAGRPGAGTGARALDDYAA